MVMRECGRILLACAAVVAGCADQSDGEPAAQREGYIESRDGVTLYYRMFGGLGDTLVVVHGGAFVDHGYLAPDLEPLAETHVLIFYDQRGTGALDKPVRIR